MTSIREQYRRTFQEDLTLARQAKQLIPDGITSDSRYCEPFPIYVDRAQGSKKWGVGGKEFIDYWAGHGALLLGHNPPEVVEATMAQMRRGTHYGACHRLEIEWADLVVELVPSAELVRFTNSGTEANLLAIRLARLYTGRNRTVRFAGHYHGWVESLMPTAETPTNNTFNMAVSRDIVDSTITCPPNDIEALEVCLSTVPDIACVIVEPTGACSGTVPSPPPFLERLREITREHGVVLIFDEVFTGFRLAPGGAQAYFQVLPDLTTLAKLLGGGLPAGAVAGKREILNLISIAEGREGKRVPHLGTTSSNPLSAAAGTAMLKIVRTGKAQKTVNRLAEELRRRLNELFDRSRLDWVAYGEFSWIKLLIGHGAKGLPSSEFNPYKWDYRQLLARGHPHLRNQLRCGLLLNGVDFAPSGVTTTAHTDTDLDDTIDAFEQTIVWMKRDGSL